MVLVALVTSAWASGCPEEILPPELQPIQSASIQVNQTLRLSLSVQNPSGLPLTWSFSGPDLPGLAEVTSLSGTPSSGEFVWTPLASHVGTHELVFTISSSSGDSSQSALITVEPSASAAPIFLRPGAGGTYDLSRSPCVSFDVEVRDDDTPEVTIRLRESPPAGALLTREGPKRGRFEWCPTAEQTDQSQRWTIRLEADDGDHAPTQHDYLIVLRIPPKEDCPGTPPVVTVQSPGPAERVTSATGFPVVIVVSDDVGVREAPLLYYTTVKPEDETNPDITDFLQAEFVNQGDSFRAEVPPLGLAPGEERTVYFIVSVTDNDDPEGTACDHRTDTPLRSFVAAVPEETVKAGLCEACTASINCQTGVCASVSGGSGKCLPACGDGVPCEDGECADRLTVEGATVRACGDVVAVCEGGGSVDECVDDANEPNDSRDNATPFPGSAVNGVICAGNEDFYRVQPAAAADVTLTLSGFDHTNTDLDLELLDSGGIRLDSSAGVGPEESVTSCVLDGEHVFAVVYSYFEDHQGSYTLSLSETPSDCCVNDDDEPDDTLEAARPIDPISLEFEGMICPGDTDHWYFEIAEPSRLDALIIFDGADADLDLELYSPTGAWLDGSYSSADDEEIVRDLVTTGRYTLRVEVYGEGGTEYLGAVSLSQLTTCSTTDDCPIGTICRDGTCDDDRACSSDIDCPSAHSCPSPGPIPAQPLCTADCALNTDCRDEGIVEETCKRFPEGRGCGLRGSGANGEGCLNFEDCGGQRACLDWPGGYCARAACASSSDCESDTFCANVSGTNVCVRRCGDGEPECRLDEGYSCQSFPEVGGAGDDQGCAPSG